MKNQLRFNKMIKTQLAQLAASLPSSESGGIPGQPEPTRENLKPVTTSGGKNTRDPPHPNPTKKKHKEVTSESDEEIDTEEAYPGEKRLRKTAPQEYVDSTLLPFPRRIKNPTVDEQFGKFIEVIKKLNVNTPFLEAMQVPTYAKYLKDILNNKRPLPTTDIVKLAEECSAAILKKKDPECPTISCSIVSEHFENALCDLGANISTISLRWGKPCRGMYASNQVQEDEVAPTKPKVKSFNGDHQPKKSRPINKAMGDTKTKIKNTPAKASTTSSPPKKTKKVWRVKRASSESSTLGLDEPNIN
jgi:hypothetical protein